MHAGTHAHTLANRNLRRDLTRVCWQQSSNTHWYLACINFKEKRTEVYDSMGGNHPEVCVCVRVCACVRVRVRVRVRVCVWRTLGRIPYANSAHVSQSKRTRVRTRTLKLLLESTPTLIAARSWLLPHDLCFCDVF